MDLDPYYRAVEYLESFISGPAEAPRSPEDLLQLRANRLPAIAHLLEVFGNPHRRFRSIHVAGTSGKGSTCVMVGSILRAAGYRVGVHTSPYLQAATEKIEVDGSFISGDEFVDLVESSKPMVEIYNATSPYGPVAYTQLSLALALECFARREVDFAVVEVGVGGRFDYTNILKPEVSAITSVSYDHVASLGPTLKEIAWHKSGVAKPGTPLITATDAPEALEVIEEECRSVGAPLYRVGREVTYHVYQADERGSRFDWEVDGSGYKDVNVGLYGEHQATNAAVALGIVHALTQRGVAVSEAAIRRGLEEAYIPGRLEVMAREPMVVLDGAHNPAKVIKLREALEAMFSYRRLILVLGILASKESQEMVAELAPLAHLTITTETYIVGKPFTPPTELAEWVRQSGGEAVCESDPMAALDIALKEAGPEDLICVTGSLYLVGAVRGRWRPLEEILTGRIK